MRLFKKKPKNTRPNRVTGYREQAIAHRQIQVAGYLNRKTQHWNRASKLMMLLLICLLFGGFSFWLLIHAIY